MPAGVYNCGSLAPRLVGVRWNGEGLNLRGGQDKDGSWRGNVLFGHPFLLSRLSFSTINDGGDKPHACLTLVGSAWFRLRSSVFDIVSR